ncbi:MAG: thioredoxin family protein [Acidobacteriota bacterium]|nr:thioredoxin family protein [Acidobacteriota bacterium]
MKCVAVALLWAVCAFAQRPDQVKWTLTLETATAAPGSKVLARMTGRIDPGWHLYSLSTPSAIPTTIKLSPTSAVVERYRVLQPSPHRSLDPNFGSDTETFEKEAVFLIELDLKNDAVTGPTEISAEVRYQTCNDKLCIPPVRRTASATLTVAVGASVVNAAIPAGYREAKPSVAAPPSGGRSAPAGDAQGWSGLLLAAFGFGVAAIFTPCVFPMIPITMSYFLNRQSAGRRDSVVQAGVFCLGIVGLFTALGLLATAILGPFGVVQLGSNPWVNGLITLLFIAFGLSLLGAFEITVPSAILTRLNQSSGRGGVAGTLLMGLTFSLASFACVGPFVGTLLAASVQEGGARPLAGMAVFATGLALPFFLLALFPSYLKRMPKSGGWLARVKVVMGFVVLAASLKYLSSLDQVLQWGVVTRERFLAAWVVLFTMAGLYLLGFFRMEGVKAEETTGLSRLLTGMAFLVFAVSLLPGMLGARLGELDAYVPVVSQGSGTVAGSQSDLSWMKNQYREALARARNEGKLVLVNFSGYACTNCHWMTANMFPRPEIAAAMKGFVLVELYTDGTDEASRANQELQLSKFNTIAIPYYAILTPDETVVASLGGLTKDPPEFLAFLHSGSKSARVRLNASATPAS